MKELQGKVAVVTGAGSGIGRAIALACAREGMALVLADIDEPALGATASLLPAATPATMLQTDVTKPEQVERLAANVVERFGAVHLLFNNAGVMTVGPAWTATLDDWDWVLGVNVRGVINGLRSFVPRMLAQGGEGHVVNTASLAGLVTAPGMSTYCVSKHAVVALSECLYHDLRLARARIGVSVLCPGFVNTGLADAARNRPPELTQTVPTDAPTLRRLHRTMETAPVTADEIASLAIDAVKAERFYVLSHDTSAAAIEARMTAIRQGNAPARPRM